MWATRPNVCSVPQLSLSELLPYNCGLPKGHLVVVLKCYFDGSNQSDSTQYEYVTLAALAGTSHQWKMFDKDWRNNLRKHNAKWLHTTDAVAMNKPFSKEDGWTSLKVGRFIRDCTKIAGRHIGRPITDTESGRVGLYPYTVTIHIKDYIRARDENEGLPVSLDEVLATEAINAVFKFGNDFAGTEYFDLIYDQNEPYRGHILDRQRHPKAVKVLQMFEKIATNTEANMRLFPPLQLADLWAWCVSHKREEQIWKWQQKMLNHPSDEAYGDYEKLSRPIQGTIDLVRKWKFPKRKRTR